VLHVAPEPCFVKRFRAQHGDGYVTADRDSYADRRVDVQALPFGEGTFDVVLCNHVLEHVDDDRLAMRELRRVLDSNGWAILQSPIDPALATTYEDPALVEPAEREKAFGQRDHVRMYGADYADRLAEAGFRVHPDDYVRTLPAETIERHALPAFETVFLCRT
jgi:SAM-dependent methyltransferase